MRIALLVLLLALLQTEAMGAEADSPSDAALGVTDTTVRKLVSMCQNADDLQNNRVSLTEQAVDDAFECLGMLRGSVAAFAFAQGLDSPPKAAFCLGKTNARQYVEVFLTWARRHQDAWQQPAALGVYRSLVAAFPCRVDSER